MQEFGRSSKMRKGNLLRAVLGTAPRGALLFLVVTIGYHRSTLGSLQVNSETDESQDREHDPEDPIRPNVRGL